MTRNLAKSIMTKFLAGLLGFCIISLGGCGGGEKIDAKILAAEEVYKIGVNAYLWRAALDTLDFMPLKSADHNGGVILMDWTVSPSNDKERSKVEVFILGKKLSADSLKVTVYRQISTDSGWTDIAPHPDAANNVADAILMQAKILRRNNAPLK